MEDKEILLKEITYGVIKGAKTYLGVSVDNTEYGLIAAGKKSITESIMRKTMKSDKRKPWEEIFFQDSFGNTLSKEEANLYIKPLEMLHLAPSATNT